MNNILMLDLEGVLVYFGALRMSRIGTRDPRPYAQQFVDECSNLFDEIYMNTCVRRNDALETLRDEFGVTNFKVHDYNGGHKYMKARDYEKFENSRIIHVEDGISLVEKQRILELGHHYIPVKSWGMFLSEEERANDRELLRVLDEIKTIIN